VTREFFDLRIKAIWDRVPPTGRLTVTRRLNWFMCSPPNRLTRICHTTVARDQVHSGTGGVVRVGP